MSVDMNQPSSSGGLKGFIHNNPTLALGGGIIAILIGGGLVLKKKAATNATTPAGVAAQTDLSGVTDASGQHIVYVPTSTNFSTFNDASQSISVGNNSNAGSIINPPPNAGIKNPGGSMSPPRKGPPTPPVKYGMSWTQHYTASNQSLNLISKNATISMVNDAVKYKISQRFEVTGRQIYDHNKGVVDSYLAKQPAHYTEVRGVKTRAIVDPLNTSLSGVSLIIPHLTKQS